MNLSPSVGPRSCAIADVPMRVASRSRAISSCCAARSPPSAGGRRRERPRRPTTRHRSGARRCRRCPARPRRGRPGRCTRRRAAPGRGWPARTTPGSSRRKPVSTSIASSSRWLVGSSSSRQDGRVVMIVASASRVRWPPERVPTTRSAPRSASPSRAAATSARRSASQASCATAASSARPYAASPSGVPTRAGEPLDVGDGRPQRRQGHREHLGDRGGVAERRLLAEQHEVVGGGDRSRDPGPRGQPPGDRPQEGRLADAVLADEADAAARLGEQVDPGQDRAVGVGDRQSGDHERREAGGGGKASAPERRAAADEEEEAGMRTSFGGSGRTRRASGALVRRRGRESGQSWIHMMTNSLGGPGRMAHRFTAAGCHAGPMADRMRVVEVDQAVREVREHCDSLDRPAGRDERQLRLAGDPARARCSPSCRPRACTRSTRSRTCRCTTVSSRRRRSWAPASGGTRGWPTSPAGCRWCRGSSTGRWPRTSSWCTPRPRATARCRSGSRSTCCRPPSRRPGSGARSWSPSSTRGCRGPSATRCCRSTPSTSGWRWTPR